MKKYLFLIILFFIFIIPNVNASNVDLSLKCNESVKQKSSITCDLYADISDEKLLEVTATIDASSTYFSVSDNNFNASEGWDTGSNIKIASFKVNSLSKTGTGNISLDNISLKFENDITSHSKISTSVKVLSDEARLNSIAIDGKVIEGFDSYNYKYDVTVSKKEIEISATKHSDTDSISGEGKHSLTCGNNKIIIKGIAESGKEQDYTLNITRKCTNDTKLKMIKLSSGALSPTFNSNTKEYKVEVSKDIEKITISVTKNNEGQKVTGEVKDAKLEYGDNKFEIKVESEMKDTTTYTVIVNREDRRSENNDLEYLKLSDGRLEFDKDTLTYTTKVLYEVTSIKVDAKAVDKTSKIEVIGGKKLKLGENEIVVKVTSEKGEIKEYKITVNRLEEGETLGNNPDIKELIIEGYEIDFDKTVLEYNLKIDDEKSLDIEVVMDDETSSYTIEGNKKLKNGSIIKINTKSLDGSTKTYTIEIEKETVSIILIIAILIVGIVAGLIVFLIINNKKDKNKVKTKIVKDKKITKTDKTLEHTKEVITSEVKEAIIIDNPEDELKEFENLVSNKKVFDKSRIEEETKECSICGNHVLKSAKVCPYCKRTWS